ncbi:MAG: glycosyltransferase family 2 protein [Deltaproteobacteria bacterium]|nr:glycosyltransferase family 2 protein [Deltaproteobacteria bacterium]
MDTPLSPHRVCAIVPALDAAATIADVVRGAARQVAVVVVVDDGSHDATAKVAREAGATVVGHAINRGKGAALRTGLEWAREHGYEAVVSLDADGQHPPGQIAKILAASADPAALVLGVRNLVSAGAPRANQLSNGFSNWFLSTVTRRALRDTQCGLRRYPVRTVLGLGVRDDGFGFETEVLLRALRAGMPIVQVDIDVLYPESRTTHFDGRRDPWRIVGRVLRTLLVDR